MTRCDQHKVSLFKKKKKKKDDDEEADKKTQYVQRRQTRQ